VLTLSGVVIGGSACSIVIRHPATTEIAKTTLAALIKPRPTVTTKQSRRSYYNMIADDVHRRLIIGGTNIPKLRYPYYVSIDKNNGVIVSGALIAPDIVLTAGHVILDNMDNLTIKIGPWAPRNNESETAQEIAVQHYMLHPDWNMTTAGLFQNDFMVMKLGESDVRHTPVALNRNADIPMVNATVNMMGLGWTQPTTLSPATVVQEATLVCVSNDECESAEDSLRGSLYLGEIDDTMLCTVSPPNTTRDGCAWDSGDPIIIKGETLEQDLLVALGSSGVTCADPVFPGECQ
jgi:secreted trypsin-like serine protease